MRPEHVRPADAGLWAAARPGRFVATIRTDEPTGCQLALLGVPFDLGVRRNGGREGASLGPQAFRQALIRYGTTFDAVSGEDLTPRLFDAGDVVPEPGDGDDAILATHARIEGAVNWLCGAGLLPIVVGGGHDATLPLVRAVAKHAGEVLGGVSLDAHLDVRRRIGSGMPFRALIEEGCVDPRRFTVVGVGPFSNDREDVEWFDGVGARRLGVEEVLRQPERVEAVLGGLRTGPTGCFVTIDLDGIDGGQAPGVSAVNPLGVAAATAFFLAREAGRMARVRSFDVMELAPPYDEGARTARLAAGLVLAFIAGFRERGAGARD